MELELNMDGKDKLSVKVKNGIQFNGIVTQVSKTGDDFVIKGKLLKEANNATED